MGRARHWILGILLLAAAGLMAGCSAGAARARVSPLKASVLFGSERSALMATQIGRSDWPATFGQIEGPEDTVYLEYYRDTQGYAFEERSNPRRSFRSYRVGTRHR